jgi:hypothetical protein
MKNYRQLLEQFKVYFVMPDGWKKIIGAQTAPSGYVWINNRKSIFDEGYQKALLKKMNE